MRKNISAINEKKKINKLRISNVQRMNEKAIALHFLCRIFFNIPFY